MGRLSLEDAWCREPRPSHDSKSWAVLFTLFYMSLFTFIECTVLNVITYKVFNHRVHRRSEARFMQTFGLGALIDNGGSLSLTLIDTFDLLTEVCNKDWCNVLGPQRNWISAIGGFFLLWRSLMMLVVQLYYLIVYVCPYRSEMIGRRVSAITFFTFMLSFSSLFADAYAVEYVKCKKGNLFRTYPKRLPVAMPSHYLIYTINGITLVFVVLIVVMATFLAGGGRGAGGGGTSASRKPPAIILCLAGAVICLLLSIGVHVVLGLFYKSRTSITPTDVIIFSMVINVFIKCVFISHFFIFTKTLRNFWVEAKAFFP